MYFSLASFSIFIKHCKLPCVWIVPSKYTLPCLFCHLIFLGNLNISNQLQPNQCVCCFFIISRMQLIKTALCEWILRQLTGVIMSFAHVVSCIWIKYVKVLLQWYQNIPHKYHIFARLFILRVEVIICNFLYFCFSVQIVAHLFVKHLSLKALSLTCKAHYASKQTEDVVCSPFTISCTGGALVTMGTTVYPYDKGFGKGCTTENL